MQDSTLVDGIRQRLVEVFAIPVMAMLGVVCILLAIYGWRLYKRGF